ncbi:hypothetical protein MUK42_02706 [Musa troglodytarum]|uniref:Uncharacterized protein n=1 Tax=Musa troglodytarum TaxID=320322 RepID=A0A9E7FVN5_9LILI|nr:hypothetical protein MUK42_02706 [Musa troglodytarum]
MALVDRKAVAASLPPRIHSSLPERDYWGQEVESKSLNLLHDCKTLPHDAGRERSILIELVSVLVELRPVSGVSHGSLVSAVSVLPVELITTKPQLLRMILVADIKVS